LAAGKACPGHQVVAELWEKSLREQAEALIAIAHPHHRDRLTFEARRSVYA